MHVLHFLQDNAGLHWPHLVGHRNICSWITSTMEVTTNKNNSHIPYVTLLICACLLMCVGFVFRIKFWLSEWVHVICYRICARGLSATIHYHNR